MARRKIDPNQKTLIPVKKKMRKSKEKIWIPKKKKKRKWSGYKPNIQGMPQSRDWCAFLNPNWCHYCLYGENAMTLGLEEAIISFEKKSKYYRAWFQITHWCQSWFFCCITGEIMRGHDTCPEFKGREIVVNEKDKKERYLGPDVEETIVYMEEVLEVCKHYNNRSCDFLNIKIESGTCYGCENR